VAAPSNGRSLVSFGLFEADLSSGELYKNGHRVPLQDKPFRLLSMLLERPGEVVTRDQVRKKLWPEGTFVDFDQGLDTALKKLRYALGDSAQSPTFIGTIPRRGYRFIAPVTSQPPILTPGVAATVQEYDESKWPPRDGIVALALIIGVSLLLLLFLSGIKQEHVRLESEPVATRPGWERNPSFSPDGNEIAFDYVDEAASDPNIYVKVLGDEKMLRLTTQPGASFCPSWSPDGQHIAYTHYVELSPGNSERTVMLMTPLGGSKHTIRRLSAANGPCRVAWSPDGKLLAYADKPTDEAPGIFLMSAGGSDNHRLTIPPDKMLDLSPAFSPDGQQIAFIRISTMPAADIYTVSLSDGEPKRVTYLNKSMGHPVWTSDGSRILFTVDGPASGVGAIYSVRSDGGEPGRLLLPDSNVSTPAVSRRGDMLAYEKSIFNMTIWKLTIPDSSEPALKFVASTRTDSEPDFSADGTKIAFSSTRDGTEAIWTCDADGTNAIRLTTTHLGGTPKWAPDGTRVVFDDRHSGRSHIYLIGVHDGSTEQVTEGNFDDEVPSWSVDGRWIYFASNRSGRYEIWKTSVVAKEPVQITHGGGLFPAESPDGQFVYYNKPASPSPPSDEEGRGVWRIPAKGGQEELVIRDPDRLWQVRPEGIYFTDNSAKALPELKLFSFATQTTKVVGHFSKEATNKGGHNLAISPDGHTALYVQIDAWNSELMLAKGGAW
jgi:Tol biopolymer transport system component/DNA-binding winged helix-turn-helix (wHTH) protein